MSIGSTRSNLICGCVVGGVGKADEKAGDLKDDCGGGIADVDGVLHGGHCYFSHIKLLDSLAPGT